MGQLGFFDADNRLTALSAKGDPLEAIDRLVPWESFRGDIEAAVLTPKIERKSAAGRKPIDTIVLFRMLILQALYNLSDEQVEYQVRDRLSFTRFLTSGIEDCIPDGTTLWLFREKLAKAGVIKKLLDRFDQHLGAKGYIARGGQIVDATIVPLPKQRNTSEENEATKRLAQVVQYRAAFPDRGSSCFAWRLSVGIWPEPAHSWRTPDRQTRSWASAPSKSPPARVWS